MFYLKGEFCLPTPKTSRCPTVMTIGGAVCDIFMESSAPELISTTFPDSNDNFILFPEGKKVEISSISYAVGGGSANVAYGLAKFGLPTAIFFKSGNDHIADFIRTNLLLNNIDIGYSITDASTPTGTSFILPSPSQDRTVLTYRGANAHVKKSELPYPFFPKFKGIYIAPISGELAQHLPFIAQKATEAGCIVMHNPSRHQLTCGIAQLLEALPFIDILMVNRVEAQVLYKTIFPHEEFSIERFFSQMRTYGKAILLLTDGCNGASCLVGDMLFHQTAYPTRVINTVGAGDAFGAAFFGALLTGKSIKEALIFGTLNSASTLSCAIPHGGLLSQAELEEKTASIIQEKKDQFDAFNKATYHETILHS